MGKEKGVKSAVTGKDYFFRKGKKCGYAAVANMLG
jgi:hypothetical protein